MSHTWEGMDGLPGLRVPVSFVFDNNRHFLKTNGCKVYWN